MRLPLRMSLCGPRILSYLFAVTLTAGVADAQITATEASREFLAMQCAISAGSSSENFRDYGASLAVTLSTLDSAQQERVFGYLPTPGAVVTPQNAVSEQNTQGAQIPNDGDQENAGLLDSLIQKTSEALGGILMPESNATPIVAGIPPSEASEGGNQDPDASGSGEAGLSEGVGGNDVGVEGDGNNGHGNSGGFDPSNPGKENDVPSGQAKKSDSDGDGNNGHGDSGGFDPSNPGKSGNNGAQGQSKK